MEALSITAITLVLSAVLSVYLTKNYLQNKTASLMFWSSGMWLFTVGVFMEVLFAANFAPQMLVDLYLFIVALIVEALALGSIQLVASKRKKAVYLYFCIITTAALAIVLALTKNAGIIKDYVAYGNPSIAVILASSLITFPASLVLAGVALISYLKRRNMKMLSILAGVIVVVIAGTLYIASFPSFLYISEFIGIVLLWFGFYSTGHGKRR